MLWIIHHILKLYIIYQKLFTFMSKYCKKDLLHNRHNNGVKNVLGYTKVRVQNETFPTLAFETRAWKRDNFPHRHLLTRHNKNRRFRLLQWQRKYFFKECFDQTKVLSLMGLFFSNLSNAKILHSCICNGLF